jgi:hypothetical protein
MFTLKIVENLFPIFNYSKVNEEISDTIIIHASAAGYIGRFVLRYSFSAADRKMEVSPTKPNAMSDK